MDKRRWLQKAISTSLPFSTNSKIFFSPESRGEFLPCVGERQDDETQTSPTPWGECPSPIVVGKDQGEASLVIEENSARVVVHINEAFRSARVMTMFRFAPSREGEWLRQDLPSGSPSEIILVEHAILTAPKSAGKKKNSPAHSSLFVKKEKHYSHGLLWDPDENTPAETCYYPSGSIHWRRRYRQGICRGGAGHPCLEVFWPSGQPKVLEYGGEGVGKHRPMRDGPAYQEFHATGHPCFVMFAETGKIKSCSWFSQEGKPIPLFRHGHEMIEPEKLLEPGDAMSEFSVTPPALYSLGVVSFKFAEDPVPLKIGRRVLASPNPSAPRQSAVNKKIRQGIKNRTSGKTGK